MKKIIAIFIAIWFSILPISGFQTVQAGVELPRTDWNHFVHELKAEPGGAKITDYYYDKNVAEPIGSEGHSWQPWGELNFFEETSKDYINSYPGDGAYAYTFKDISATAPYVFLVDWTTLQGSGIYVWNDSQNLYNHVGLPQIWSNDSLNTDQRQHLASLVYGFSDTVIITDMTPTDSKLGTSASLDCSDFSLGKIDYTNSSGQNNLTIANFKSADEFTRYSSSKPPKDAFIKLWYQPPGAPADYWKEMKEFPIKRNGNFNLNYTKLPKGNYFLESSWAIKYIQGRPDQYQFDNLQTRGNFTTEWYRMRWPASIGGKIVASVGLATATLYTGIFAPIAALAFLEKNKASLYKEIYSGYSNTFTVSDDSSTVTGDSCNNLKFDVAFIKQTVDAGGGGPNDVCGGVKPDVIFQWAFCEFLLGVQALANWAFQRACNIFSNITGTAACTDTTATSTAGGAGGSAGGGSSGAGAATGASGATPATQPQSASP